jgi:hypothetical protein
MLRKISGFNFESKARTTHYSISSRGGKTFCLIQGGNVTVGWPEFHLTGETECFKAGLSGFSESL